MNPVERLPRFRPFRDPLLWLLLAAWSSWLAAASAASYTIITIPRPAGGDWRHGGASGINDRGDVAGAYVRFIDPSGFEQVPRAFVYTDLGGTSELPWPAGWVSRAVDINNRGQVAFYGAASGAPFVAYRYTPGVGYEPLGNFGGLFTEPDAINNLGQLTGYSEGPDGHARAFRYSDDVGLEYIGGSFISSRGLDINDRGWVVGGGGGHAFVYRDNEGVIDLGSGAARGINNAGVVVGEAFLPNGDSEAFVYENGQMRPLGHLGGGTARLDDINEYGVAVGTGSILLEGGIRSSIALYWSEATGLINLNTLLPENSGWHLASATAINEYGQITGNGTFNGVIGTAYRLDLIPEPCMWVLFGLGTLVLWLRFRRNC